MSQGLQVFDSSGNLMIDITNRLTRYIGIVDTGANSGQLTNDALVGGDLWISVIGMGAGTFNNSQPIEYPRIEKSGNTLTWSYSTAYKIQLIFAYGVY